MSIEDIFQSPSTKRSTQISPAGKWVVGITGGIAVGITVICAPFITPALRRICLPYVPATTKQMSNILIALKGRTGNVVDLGSGDGRIVLETAKNKFMSHGVELNLWLVLYSRIDAYLKRLSGKTKFFHKNLWEHNISGYDNVVIFGVEQMMPELEIKIQKECKPGCSIIACRFPLPNMTPAKTIGNGIDAVWVYDIKKS